MAMHSIYWPSLETIGTFTVHKKIKMGKVQTCSLNQSKTTKFKIPWDSHAKLVIINDLTITPKSSAIF